MNRSDQCRARLFKQWLAERAAGLITMSISAGKVTYSWRSIAKGGKSEVPLGGSRQDLES
jgi:hypothetical protein